MSSSNSAELTCIAGIDILVKPDTDVDYYINEAVIKRVFSALCFDYFESCLRLEFSAFLLSND